MIKLEQTAQWFERAKTDFQAAVVGAVFSDAAGMIMNMPMNTRAAYSFWMAVGCAVLADRYIAKPAMNTKNNEVVWGRQPE